LVYNAGIGPSDDLIGTRTSESSEEELRHILNVNLFSLRSRVNCYLFSSGAERGRPYCKPRQHSRISYAACGTTESLSTDAPIRLECFKSGGEPLHYSFWRANSKERTSR
jgi:hypothetical protein